MAMAAKKMKTGKSAAKAEGKAKITKDMTLGEVMQKYPETVEIMLQQGLHCIGCHIATYETIEQGAMGHGIDPKKLIDEMNKAVGKKKK